MYMIMSGELSVYDDEGRHLTYLSAGEAFGETAALGVERYRLATIRADTYCELGSITREDLFKAFRDRPEVLEEMKEFSRKEKMYKNMVRC